ncbi:MAG: histidine kinase [Marinoscillum sp.]
MSSRTFPRNNFFIANSLCIGLLFLFFWVKALSNPSYENVIFWPGAYFISIWLLSQIANGFILSSSFEKLKSAIVGQVIVALGFGVAHLLLTGLLTILLERFCRFPEHYTFKTFGQYLFNHWYLVIEGLIWYTAYLIVLLFFKLLVRYQTEKYRSEVLKKDLRHSDLTKLRNELNPHFLFNAMNGIAMKVRLGENKVAVSMIAALNDLLRLALTKGEDKSITLEEELKLLDKYLIIEKTRFGDTVHIQFDLNQEILNALVPQLILQPLVENAFKHSIKEHAENQIIKIAAVKKEGHLIMTVYNTTKNPASVNIETSGVGLSNIIQRLKRLYGTNFRFQSQPEENGLTFIITIPYQT